MQGSNAIVTEQMPRGGWEVALKSPHQEQPNPGMQITQSQAGVKVKTKIQWEEADPSGHGRHWVGGGQESQCQACSCVGICLVSRVHLRAGTDNDKLEFSPLNISIVTDGAKEVFACRNGVASKSHDQMLLEKSCVLWLLTIATRPWRLFANKCSCCLQLCSHSGHL